MGTSTDAIIAYGFDLGAEEDLPEHLSALLCKHEHEVEPALAEDHGLNWPAWQAGGGYAAYEAAQNAVLKQIPIDLIAHCSGEYTMYFLAARGSNQKARRGYPQALEPADLNADKFAPAVDAMRAFCDRHGIEWQEPKWHIFSWWF